MAEADRLFTKYNIVEKAADLYKLTQDPKVFEFENIQVPIISINLRTADTTRQLIYDSDLMDSLKTDTYYKPQVVYGYGDKTVDAYSQFIPLLKWAKEFDDGVPGAAPVKIVDFCSVYNVKYSPFDGENTEGEKVHIKNDFFGISCNCISSSSPLKCNHSMMIQDDSALELIGNTLLTHEVSYSPIYDIYVESLDEEYLLQITTNCPQVVY